MEPFYEARLRSPLSFPPMRPRRPPGRPRPPLKKKAISSTHTHSQTNQRRMVRNLFTLYAENESGNYGITVIKIRAFDGGYEVVSKKEYNDVSAGLLQLVKGRGKFMEYNRFYTDLEAQHGIPLLTYSELTFDVESLVRVSSSTADDVYGVWEFKSMVSLLHKYCAGTMLIREMCKWHENAHKRKWQKINARRALKHRMGVCFTAWTSQTLAVDIRLDTDSTQTWFPKMHREGEFTTRVRIQTFAIDNSYRRGTKLILKEGREPTGPAIIVQLKQNVYHGGVVSCYVPMNWNDLVDEEVNKVNLENFADARLVPKPKPKTRRAGVKKRNKKSAVASPLPIVDEDEELVLEANEPQRIVQNLSELAISVDAALDDGNDAASVVQSSVASAQACIVCFENAMEAACIPCGHRCLCVDCADRFRHPGAKCPVCRDPLVMVCKIWG